MSGPLVVRWGIQLTAFLNQPSKEGWLVQAFVASSSVIWRRLFYPLGNRTGSLPDEGSLQEAESVIEVIDVIVELRLGD